MIAVKRNLSKKPIAPSYRRYWLRLYRREVDKADLLVKHALRAWSPQRIYMQLFEPALDLSGSLWAAGRITYADEHFITHQTLRFMRQVRRRFVPLETFGPLALVTNVGSEGHRIGLQMVCDFLGWANWRIHRLSSNDRATLARCLQRIHPDAILMSLSTEENVPAADRLIREIHRQHYKGLIVIGGRVVNSNPALVQKLGADMTAPNAASLVRLLGPRFANRKRARVRDDCLLSLGTVA